MKLDTTTSAVAVANKIRALILGGHFVSGASLRQDRLSQALGVSRTPLRHALQMLSEEGLVTITGFKGARVIEITSALIDDLFEMRLALEPLALQAAFPHISKLDLVKAEVALDDAQDETDPARLSDLNWAFHNALYAPSKRELLLGTIQRLHRTSALAEVIAQSITAREHQSHVEHLALIEACRADDKQAALDVLDRHLRLAQTEVNDAFQE